MTTNNPYNPAAAQGNKLKRVPKVIEIKRSFRTTKPAVAGLSGEMADRWLKGQLTLSISKAFQTRREVVEVLVRDEVRAALRKAA